MIRPMNLQDTFLNEARRHRAPLTVFLVNGFQMRGTVQSFDSFTVMLDSDGRQQLIYKHAISTIAPARALVLPDIAPETDTPEREPALMR